MITIYSPNGTAIMAVQERDESRYTHSLMGEHSVRLRFDWSEAIPLPYGSYIDYANSRWRLFASYIPAQRDGVAEYDVAFHAPEVELANFTAFYLSQGTMEAEWELTGTMEQFAREIEANLRRISSPLTIKPQSYATAREARHISVERISIAELLGKVSAAFGCEWWLEGLELKFGRIPQGTEQRALLGELASSFAPLGEGNPLISRLYAFGSTRNLTSKYRQGQGAISRIAEPRLHTPASTPYLQGTTNGIEQVEYFEDVYPRYEGTLTAVSSRQSESDTIYKVSDTALLIKQEHIIEGQTLRLHFSSGALQGMDFDLSLVSGGYEIVPNDTYGQRLPGGNLIPRQGDRYVPYGFDISMVGSEYVPRAEQELLQRATEWLRSNNEDRRDVEVACNPIWIYERGLILSLGQAIRLVDATPTGDKVGRITRIEYPLYCPEALTLTVGNTKPLNRLESLRAEIGQQAQTLKAFAETKQREVLRHTGRGFRQVVETMQGLLATMGERFGGEVNPVAVKTMQLLAGDERLQFVFVKSSSDRSPKALNVEYLSNSKRLRIGTATTLMHYTLPAGRTLSPRDTAKLRTWELQAYQSPSLSDRDKPYYLYALVQRAEGNSSGRFMLSLTKLEDSPSEYALLVGMLSSEDAQAERSFVSLHGFSEILPGRITTDRIVSANGISFFDLLTGQINGRITITNDKGQTIMGTHNDKGQTIVDGGLVLSQIIGGVDADGKLRSYLSGDPSKPAFVAGLSDDGSESNVCIKHNGDAKFGQAQIDGATGRYSFSNAQGEHYMRIGGNITPLETLLSTSGSSSVHQVSMGHTGMSADRSTETMPIQVPTAGASLILSLTYSTLSRNNILEDSSTSTLSGGGRGFVDMKIRVIYEGNNEVLWSDRLSCYGDNDDTARVSKHLAGLKAGRYRLECEVAGDGRFEASVRGTAELKWVGDIKEIALGEDGLSLYYGKDRLLYAQRNGDPFLTIRGNTLINGIDPAHGVLLSGSVSGSYTFENVGGVLATGARVRKHQNGGRFEIVHNLGHSRYQVCITPRGNQRVVHAVFQKGTNSFVVQFQPLVNTNNVPVPFDFLMIGSR